MAVAFNIVTTVVSVGVIASTIQHVHMTHGFYLFVSIDELTFAVFIVGMSIAAAVYCFKIRSDAVRQTAPPADFIYSAEMQENKPLNYDRV